jgi:hypothetical protein
MELEARVFLYSMNDVKVILRMRSALDTQLKAGRITAEDVAEEMRQWAGKIEANIKTVR